MRTESSNRKKIRIKQTGKWLQNSLILLFSLAFTFSFAFLASSQELQSWNGNGDDFVKPKEKSSLQVDTEQENARQLEIDKVKQQVDEDATPYREEFALLNLCDIHHPWYYCKDNPTCVAIPTCDHRNNSNHIEFKNHFRSGIIFLEESNTRRKSLQKILDDFRQVKNRNPATEKKILVMTLNSGFSFLFGNWICSMLAHNVDVELVKQHTLVIARDKDAFEYVTKLGFYSPTMEQLRELTAWTFKHEVSRSASKGFGQGSHNQINLFLKFGMPLDLLSLGYQVYTQDVDFIWFKNPLEEIKQKCDAENCNIIFMHEGRIYDSSPDYLNRFTTSHILEYNTGLMMYTPKPSTLHFLKVLIQGVFLQQWRRRDQMYYNHVMWHRHFQYMNWSVLSDETYVPGFRLHGKNLLSRPLGDDLTLIHVSDTGNFQLKIARLKQIKNWYFEEETCPIPVKTCHSILTCWKSVIE